MAPGEHHHRFLNSVLDETICTQIVYIPESIDDKSMEDKRRMDWCDGRTTLSVCPKYMSEVRLVKGKF